MVFGEQRCFTFVDLVPLDLSALRRIVNELLTDAYVRNGLATRVDMLEAALVRRDFLAAFDFMAYIIGHLVARTPRARRAGGGSARGDRRLRRPPRARFPGRDGRVRQRHARDRRGVRREPTSAASPARASATRAATSFASRRASSNFSQCVANPVCGNGVLEINEECDNGARNSDTAPDACRTNCKRAYCGDKVIDTFEDCEGRDLGGYNCAELGYDGGTLRCYDEYCEFNDESCDEGDFH